MRLNDDESLTEGLAEDRSDGVRVAWILWIPWPKRISLVNLDVLDQEGANAVRHGRPGNINYWDIRTNMTG